MNRRAVGSSWFILLCLVVRMISFEGLLADSAFLWGLMCLCYVCLMVEDVRICDGVGWLSAVYRCNIVNSHAPQQINVTRQYQFFQLSSAGLCNIFFMSYSIAGRLKQPGLETR